MIIAARQARTANTCAPLQERAATATGRIRDLFRPSMRLWTHARYGQQMSGTAAAILDASGRGITVTQAIASKQPAVTSTSNVKAWVFDGVNDALSTSAIDLTATSQITVAYVHRAAAAQDGVILETSTDSNTNNGAAAFFQLAAPTAQLASTYQFGGQYQYKDFAAPIGNWRGVVSVGDTALAAADELKIYANGSRQTVFVNTIATNFAGLTFGNYAGYIGGRAGTSIYLRASLASLLVLQVALDDTSAATLSTLLRQAAGVP